MNGLNINWVHHFVNAMLMNRNFIDIRDALRNSYDSSDGVLSKTIIIIMTPLSFPTFLFSISFLRRLPSQNNVKTLPTVITIVISDAKKTKKKMFTVVLDEKLNALRIQMNDGKKKLWVSTPTQQNQPNSWIERQNCEYIETSKQRTNKGIG